MRVHYLFLKKEVGFQPKTKLRREGWRLLIKKESADDEKTHLEKYFDELETC